MSEAVREGETVTPLRLSELHPFPNHPFKVRDDDAMKEMLESVMEHGVLTPAIVRPCEGGGYEIVAGHRRKHACEQAGLETMPCLVRVMDDDLATILMVDSNIQRDDVLPSEKAAAYKMKLDAIRRRAGRPPQKNCDQVGHNFFDGKKSVEIVAEQAGESKTQVQRYIRLNQLSPQLQQMVDDKKIAMTPAVELSYLKPEEQAMLVETLDGGQTAPSLSQAQRLKKSSQAGGLDREAIRSIMEDTPAQATPAPPRRTAPEEPASPAAPRPRRGQIADDIARLKDPNKVCLCTPEIFLTAFSELADRFRREVEVFTIPYYEAVFPNLSPKELDALRQQVDMIRAAAEEFYQNVKGLNVHEE